MLIIYATLRYYVDSIIFRVDTAAVASLFLPCSRYYEIRRLICHMLMLTRRYADAV